MRREAAEQVRPQHGVDHGAVAAAGVPGQAAVRGVRHGAVRTIHERHHVLPQVGAVAPGARRVDELRAAQPRPGIDVHDHGRRRPGHPRRVQLLDWIPLPRPPVAPHVDRVGEPLQDVDGRESALRLGVVGGWQLHEQRPHMRVPQRIAGERLAVDDALLDPPDHRVGPRRPQGSPVLLATHRPRTPRCPRSRSGSGAGWRSPRPAAAPARPPPARSPASEAR